MSNSKNNSEVEGKRRKVHWTSVLPNDVLKLILARLNWVDRVRSSLVSKNFAGLLHEIPRRPMERLPWLMTIFYDEPTPADLLWRCSSRCTLTDPSSNRTYNVGIDEVCVREKMLEPVSWHSRHGWLLLQGIDGEYHCFSLYRPYNKEFMVLPKLEFHPGSAARVTFSMDPTSLDYCCFFFVRVDRSMLTLSISMCHIGDNDWSNLKFDLSTNHQGAPRIDNVTCADGYLYCALDSGNQLGILDVARQEWKLFTDCMQLPPELHLGCPMDVTSFHGDLFLLYREWSESEFLLFTYIWRFDKFLKQWERQQNLGNLALFVGRPSFLVEAVGESSPYANTIHSVGVSGLTFSSFSGKFGAAALYEGRTDTSHRCSFAYWIEPPLLYSPK